MSRPRSAASALIFFFFTAARRRNVASSIRRFCAALDTPPEQAPATFWFFRERLERFHPSQAALKPHRWQTIRSDVAFALRRIGLAPDQPKPRQRLSAAWTTLRDIMREAGSHWGLSRLARFCDARQVQPAAVDDAVMDAYLGVHPHADIQDQARSSTTGMSAASGTGWLKPPRAAAGDDPRLSQRLYADLGRAAGRVPGRGRGLARGHVGGGRPPRRGRPVRPHRPASIKSYRYAIRQVVAGLQHGGRSLETIDSLAVLVEPDAATAALQFHLDRNGGQPSQMLAKIANVLVLIAQHAVGADAAVLAKLEALPRAALAQARRPPPAAPQGPAPVRRSEQHREAAGAAAPHLRAAAAASLS